VKVIDSPSPNQNLRPEGVKPRLVVIHTTAGDDEGGLSWLRDPKSRVSAHYLVLRNGAIHRLVDVSRRAWHAGLSEWQGVPNVNDYSIGIELVSRYDQRVTEAQYAAAGWLCSIFEREFGIGPEDVVGHYHVSPGRKTDPWYSFEWGRLFEAMDGGQVADHRPGRRRLPVRPQRAALVLRPLLWSPPLPGPGAAPESPVVRRVLAEEAVEVPLGEQRFVARGLQRLRQRVPHAARGAMR